MFNGVVKQWAKNLLRQSYKYGIFYIRSRDEMPYILNALNLMGEGVEIGVKQGVFSENLLRIWKGGKLYSIDPWKYFPEEEYVDISNVSQQIHDQYYAETIQRLKTFGKRSEVMRYTSKEASIYFEDRQLDFVYLDAQHHYKAVKEDIELWYPKIKKGGILAGHDYLDGTREEGVFGVKSAVDEFRYSINLRLLLTDGKDGRSWFVFI